MNCPKCNAPNPANANRCGKCLASLTAGTAAVPRVEAATNLHAIISGIVVLAQLGLILFCASFERSRSDEATPFLVFFLLLTVINFGYSAYAVFARKEPGFRWIAWMVFIAHSLLALWVAIIVIYRLKRGF